MYRSGAELLIIVRNVKIGTFVVCLAPLACITFAAAFGRLGPDPNEALVHYAGEWVLWMLALTLLLSPLHKGTGQSLPIKLRRTLVPLRILYGCMHFSIFLQFYLGWDMTQLFEELAGHLFITLGFSAWLLMLPLAATSTRAMQRRLRGNCKRLHRLFYPASVLACLHLLWQARSDVGEALVYLVIFTGLLVCRVWRFYVYQRIGVATGT